MLQAVALPQEPAAEDPGHATRFLGRLADGDQAAAGQLLELLYAELRRAAAGHMQGERDEHTLQPTALVHEAWIRLVGTAPQQWTGRAHFLRAASQAMRRILIDHARGRQRHKRKTGAQEPLDEWLLVVEAKQLDVCALDEALQSLEAADPELARLVELRFFGGLTIEETAEVLERSTASTERDWRVARALLRRLLDPHGGKSVDCS